MSQYKLLVGKSGSCFDISSGEKITKTLQIHHERSQEIICLCFSLFLPTEESLFTVSGVRLKPEMCDLLASYQKGHHPVQFSKCWWKERVTSPKSFQVSGPNRTEKQSLPGGEDMVHGYRAPLFSVWFFIPTLETGGLTSLGCERRIIMCLTCLSHSQRSGKASKTELRGHCEAFSWLTWNKGLQLAYCSPLTT